MDLSKYRKVISSPRLKIRPLEIKDSELIVMWRNQDYIREVSRQDKKISLSEHKKWFKDSREHRLDYVFIDKKSTVPIGVVSFDYSKNSDILNGYLEMSKYIGNKDYLGKGLAYEVCNALFCFLESKNSIDGIYAITKKDNNINIKLNTKLGFVIHEDSLATYNQKIDMLVMKKIFHKK